MTSHFQLHELQAEWARAAYVVGCHGPHVWGPQVATLHRFITHPHIQEEPMSTTPAGPSAAQIAAYAAEMEHAHTPTSRRPARMAGYRAGYSAANVATEDAPTPAQVEQYRYSLAEAYHGYAYCSSAALGYRDGWAAAREQG